MRSNIPFYVDAVTITVSVIIAAAFIVLIIVLLNTFVFRHRNDKKLVLELRKKYEHAHSLLIGQASSNVKRLELLADVNLLVVPTYEKFNHRYERLRDYNDKLALKAIENLDDKQKQKNHKEFKTEYAKQLPIILAFEKEVQSLHRDVKAAVKPEDDARQASLEIKEELRQVKAYYRSHQTELGPIDSSFRQVFENVENVFREYERSVEVGEYAEANEKLDKLDKVVKSLKKVLGVLPELCLRTYSELPERIIELEKAYDLMIQNEYPLHYLMIKTNIDAMNSTLTTIDRQLHTLDISNVAERLDEMEEKIDQLLASFEVEKTKKGEYDSRYEGIYQEVTDLERNFVKLAKLMPTIKKVYIIPKEKDQIITDIKVKINELNNTKRQLDTFVHSATRQPYSVLVEKIDELHEETANIEQELDEYHRYLNSLKSDSQYAFNKINEVYHQLKEYEFKLRELNVEVFKKRNNQQIDNCYSLIENINATLHIQPMNVHDINEEVGELEEISSTLFSQLAANLNFAQLTENVIIVANKFRAEFSEVHSQLNHYETLFNEGEFNDAYVGTGKIIKEYWDNK